MFLVSIPQKIKNQGVKFMLRKAKQIISYTFYSNSI